MEQQLNKVSAALRRFWFWCPELFPWGEEDCSVHRVQKCMSVAMTDWLLNLPRENWAQHQRCWCIPTPVPTVILAYTGSSKPARATWDPVPTFSLTKGKTTGNQIWSGSCSLSTFALEPSKSDDLIHRSSCMSYCLWVLEDFSWWLG